MAQAKSIIEKSYELTPLTRLFQHGEHNFHCKSFASLQVLAHTTYDRLRGMCWRIGLVRGCVVCPFPRRTLEFAYRDHQLAVVPRVSMSNSRHHVYVTANVSCTGHSQWKSPRTQWVSEPCTASPSAEHKSAMLAPEQSHTHIAIFIYLGPASHSSRHR